MAQNQKKTTTNDEKNKKHNGSWYSLCLTKKSWLITAVVFAEYCGFLCSNKMFLSDQKSWNDISFHVTRDVITFPLVSSISWIEWGSESSWHSRLFLVMSSIRTFFDLNLPYIQASPFSMKTRPPHQSCYRMLLCLNLYTFLRNIWTTSRFCPRC